MFIKEPGTFHDSIKPIVQLNFIIGMGAYRQPNISHTAYVFMQVYTIIVTLMNWTTAYVGLIAITSRTFINDDAKAAYNVRSVLLCVLLCINSFIGMASPFLIWFKNKVLKDCLQDMQIMDNTFQDIFGARNDYKKQYIRLSYRVIFVVLVSSIIGIYDLSRILLGTGSLWVKLAIEVTVHYPIILALVLDLNFCTLVGYLDRKFRDLNDDLLGLAEKPSALCPGRKIFVIPLRVSKVTVGSPKQNMKTEKHYLLQEIRKVHLDLSKLAEKINLVFGLHNLLSMGYAFVAVTGASYTIYGAIMRMPNFAIPRLVDVVPSIVWIVINVSKIWVVNHSCWSACNEAEKTGQVIYELMEPGVDEEFRKEIQEFGVQMLQNPVCFNACGFFTLDYTLVQSVIGSITTYLVILIQMLHASASPTSNKVLGWNVTKTPANY